MAESPTKRIHTCVQCGGAFLPKRTDRTLCCSRACGFELTRARWAATKAVYADVAVYRIWARHAAKRRREEARAVGRIRIQAALDCVRTQRAEAPCATCGGPVGDVRTKPKRFCSSRCRKSSEDQRTLRRAYKARRKAKERGAGRCERFDPLDVLRRDGWRCHLCGVKTPERLRGTTHPRAPELDHIVPLSKGGEHSRRNTACACRHCNIAKGDRIVGQMRLVG